MEYDLTFFENGRRPPLYVNEKQPKVFQMEGKLKMEVTLNIFL